MAGRRIKSPKVKESEYPYSKAIMAGPFLFISGCVPRWPDGRVITDNIEAGREPALKTLKTCWRQGPCRSVTSLRSMCI